MRGTRLTQTMRLQNLHPVSGPALHILESVCHSALEKLKADRTYLESARLLVVPLLAEELELYLRSDFSFEDHFGLNHHPRNIDDHARKALTERVLPKVRESDYRRLYYTLWAGTDKTLNTLVAGIVFKGPPNEQGEVELGAGTLEGFMNRGYMSEITRMMCGWASKQPEVKSIIANSSPDNFASHRTLQKSGFEIVKKEEENWRWRFKSETHAM